MALNPQINNRSLAVAQKSLELATHVGIKTDNRTFNRVDAALYLAQIVVRVQGTASQTNHSTVPKSSFIFSGQLRTGGVTALILQSSAAPARPAWPVSPCCRDG